MKLPRRHIVKAVLVLSLMWMPRSSWAQEPQVVETTSQVLERVNQLTQASKYEEAQKLVEGRLAQKEVAGADQILLKNALADVHYAWGEYFKSGGRDNDAAVQHFQIAYESDKVLRRAQARRDLDEMGGTYYGGQKNFQQAFNYWKRALDITRELKDRPEEIRTLVNLASVCQSMNRLTEALDYRQQLLSVYREQGDHNGEAWTLDTMQRLCCQLQRYEEAISFCQQGATAFHLVGNREGEGTEIACIGTAYEGMGKTADALHYYKLSLSILREAKARGGEAWVLDAMAMLYQKNEDYDDAIKNTNLSLAIYQEIGNRRAQATCLQRLFDIYFATNHFDKQLSTIKEVVTIYHELDDKRAEAQSLSHLWGVLSNLGRFEEALIYARDTLRLYRELNDNSNIGGTLFGFGGLSLDLGRSKEAEEYYEQALSIFQQEKDEEHVAAVLVPIGLLQAWKGKSKEAIDSFQQALSFFRGRGDRGGQGYVLYNMGRAYRQVYLNELQQEKNHLRPELTQYLNKSVDCLNEAIVIAYEGKDRGEGSLCYIVLIDDYIDLHLPEAAIICGKLAINHFQSVRLKSAGLEQGIKQSYISQYAGTYHLVARLLIERGRFPEAYETLDMLQKEEFLDFLQGDQRLIPKQNQTLNYSLGETVALSEQKRQITSLVTLITKESQLAQISTPTAAQKAQLLEVTRLIQEQHDQLVRFYAELPKRFPNDSEAIPPVSTLPEDIGEILKNVGGKAAYIAAFADDKGVEVLGTLRVGSQLVPFNRSFKPNDDILQGQSFSQWLNTEIATFNQAIIRREDVTKSSRELYDVLFCRGQVEKELHDAGINTILWRLTGTLRSIPIAALNDGQGYVIQKYAVVVLTAGSSKASLTYVPARTWRALGVGISKSRVVEGTRFPPLPGAPRELRTIIRDPKNRLSTGILFGKVMCDDQFTTKSFFAALQKSRPDAPSPFQVVHIASHYWQSSNTSESFLITGDPAPLTFAALQAQPNLFDGVELVTLSACDTARTSGNNGRGVDSLAALIELKGAKAVLGTLWPIDDKQTVSLMADFYSLHKAYPQHTKAWALREAQLRMLKRGGIYAHPYFWAAFTLAGNGR